MVSMVFTYEGNQSAPYNAAQKQMIAEWHESGLVLGQADMQSGSFDALEMLQVDWQGNLEDGAASLLAASSLIHRTDIPLTLISASGRASAVPQAVWDSNRATAEFKFWHGEAAQQQVFAHPTEHRIMIHWEMPETVWHFFTERFAIVTARHVLHELLANDHKPEPCLSLLAVADKAWITVYNHGRLQHVQNIPLSAGDSFTYALLDRCRIHGIDPATTPLIISGRLATDGQVMKQISRFFGHVVWHGAQPVETDQIPAHYFTYLQSFMLQKSEA